MRLGLFVGLDLFEFIFIRSTTYVFIWFQIYFELLNFLSKHLDI